MALVFLVRQRALAAGRLGEIRSRAPVGTIVQGVPDMKWRGVAAVIFVCLLSLAPASAQPVNHIIVPGVSVGDIQLGWTQRQVLNRLGMPDEISNDRGSDATQNVYWVYPQDDRKVLVVSWTKRSGEAGGVDFIFTDAAKYVTSRGIAMQNSTFKEILEKYGAPERMQGAGRAAVMVYYEAQGVRFRVDGEGGKVTAITVIPKKT